VAQPTERLVAAFARLDGDAMAACHSANASFQDQAFSLQGQRQIGGMWRTLCSATGERGRAAWKLDLRRLTDRSAHWEAHWEAQREAQREACYRFNASGRLVHKRIDAEFDLDAAGLAQRHRDRFDFWRWSRQALGLPGRMLGSTPFPGNKVRAQAAAKLQQYLAKRSA